MMKRVLPVIILCFLGVIIYSNTFQSSFQFDDGENIVTNRGIHNLNLISIWNIWPTRFITFLTFALNYHFGKLDVFGYHLVNLIIHIGASVLLWWLILLTFKTPLMKKENISSHADLLALFGALVFLTHPLQTESVTYIYQRCASLTGFLYLLSLSLYIRSRLSNHKFLYILSWIFGLISMFTKEHAFTLPLAVLLYEFFFFKTERRIQWRHALPFLILLPIILLLEFTVKPVTFIDLEMLREKPIAGGYYLLTQFRVLVTYLRLLLIPINQNLDYDYSVSRSLFEMPTFLSFLFLLSILFIAFKTFKRYRLISFGIFWFYLTLLPESSIVPLGDLIFEHRLYLPMVGFSFILVNTAYLIIERKGSRFIIPILIIIISAFSILTYKRNFVWKDQLSLWSDAARKSPNKARPRNNQGFAYYNRGNIEQAILDYNQAIKIKPNFAIAYNNRGAAYAKKDNIDKAIADFIRAIELNSNYSYAYFNLGNAFVEKEDFDKAISYYNQAIKINANFYSVYYNRGLAFLKKEDLDQAISDFSRAIKLSPESDEAYFSRGNIYLEKGNYDQAILDYGQAIKLNPKHAEPYYNRGNIYVKKENYDRAISDFTQAINLNPNMADAYYNRGNMYLKKDNLNRAISDFTQAINLNPNMADAYYNRGNAYYKKENYDQAVSDYNEAIKINPKYVEAFTNRAVAYFSKREYEKAWEDVHKVEELGGKVHSEFLEELKKASGRKR